MGIILMAILALALTQSQFWRDLRGHAELSTLRQVSRILSEHLAKEGSLPSLCNGNSWRASVLDIDQDATGHVFAITENGKWLYERSVSAHTLIYLAPDKLETPVSATDCMELVVTSNGFFLRSNDGEISIEVDMAGCVVCPLRGGQGCRIPERIEHAELREKLISGFLLRD